MDQELERELETLVVSEAARRGLTAEELRSHRLSVPHVKARRRIAKIAYCEGYSFPQIGRALNRHHTTVVSLVHGRRP